MTLYYRIKLYSFQNLCVRFTLFLKFRTFRPRYILMVKQSVQKEWDLSTVVKDSLVIMEYTFSSLIFSVCSHAAFDRH